MEITLNGKKVPTQHTTLVGLLGEIELPKIFVVEKNGAVIYKEDYETTSVENGDIIEIASFCGGG
jgi:thiamine biosynthesis protein ThiS